MNPLAEQILKLAIDLAEEDGPALMAALTHLFQCKCRENAMRAALASADAALDAEEASRVKP